MDGAVLERLTDRLLEAESGTEPVDPVALLFLLRRFGATDRAPLGDAVGLGLARALEEHSGEETIAREPDWLWLFREAASLSDDPRVLAAVTDATARLQSLWGNETSVDLLARSIEACLNTSALVGNRRDLVARAIDELERFVGAAYRPGEGIARRIDQPEGARGHLADQLHTAWALLTAESSTGRLPYAMLAEELVLFARRRLWDEPGGGFFEQEGSPAKPFALNCEAVRVLCQLADLRSDSGYADRAAGAPGTDYVGDARRILSSLDPATADRSGSGIYGIVLDEWLAMSR